MSCRAFSRSGLITEVRELREARVDLVFRDSDRERDIHVVFGDTTGECDIQSRKTDRWVSLGTPVRLDCVEAEDLNEAMNKFVMEIMQGRFESTVAAAHINANANVLDWFGWSEKHR